MVTVCFIIGFFLFFCGFFSPLIREWKMRWFQYRSGASRETVEDWFRPGHDVLSNVLRQGFGITAGWALMGYGFARLQFPDEHSLWSAYDIHPAILGYSIVIALLLALLLAAALCLFRATHMGNLNILWFLRSSGYNYTVAKEDCRRLFLCGYFWEMNTRFISLPLFVVGLACASGLVEKLLGHAFP
jgi:hypothetical protein